MVDQHEVQRWREVVAEELRLAGDPTHGTQLPGFWEQETPWRYDTVVGNFTQVADRVLEIAGPDVDSGGEAAPAGEETGEASGSEGYDLVVNRHRRVDAERIASLLQPDGLFLTEQVGADDLHEVRELLAPAGTDSPQGASAPATLIDTEHALVRAGLTIERADAFRGHYEFSDLDALLRYLVRMPWLPTPDLEDPAQVEALADLATRVEDGPLSATMSRFVLLARAPGTPDEGRLDLNALPDDDLEVPRV